VATVPVAIARRSGDSATLLAAYLPTTVGDGIVFGKMLPNDPRRGKREALTAEAAGWLPEAAPEPLAFFAAAEVCCYGSGFDTAGSVLVVTAPVDAVGAGLEVLTTAEQVLEKRAQGADGVWMTLDAIATLTASCADSGAAYRVAAAAIAKVDSYLRATEAAPEHTRAGVRLAQAANVSASPRPPAAKQLPERMREASAGAKRFAELLRSVTPDEDGDASFADFCHGMADSVATDAWKVLPEELHATVLPEVPTDLLQRRFMHIAQTPTTKPLPARGPQKPPPNGWWPDSIHDIVEAWALDDMAEWYELNSKWHANGGGEAGRPGARAYGLDAIKPKARGYLWDLRGGKGHIKLWNNDTEPKRTCMARDKAKEFFHGCRDKELLSMLDTGVSFKCDLPHQIVLMPNLHSLYAENGGIEAAASQMRAMASEGWLGMFGSVIPSCPFRCIPRGEVPKKGSVELRGIADQGQPRKRLRTQRSREPVPALNDVAREGEWDHEDKDTVQAAVLNGLIVQALADLNNEPVIDIALDWSKWFHRAWYNAYELWLAGALVPDAVKGSLLAFAIEYVLSMGATPSSQIMQRLATAMTAKLCAEFDELERARSELPGELTAAAREALEQRGTLRPDATFGTQAKLYSALMYTDDMQASISGPERAMRFLRLLWYRVGPPGLNLPLSRAEKQQAGFWNIWLGAASSTAMGVVWLPEDKAGRAAAQLEQALEGLMTAGKYREMVGLLVHLLFMMGGDDTLLHHIFRPLQKGEELHTGGPAAIVNIDPAMRGVLQRWHVLITNTPGCAAAAAAAPMEWSPAIRRHRIRADAALLGTEAPGLGGWYAGEWWCVPLASMKGLELLDIPHLEFLASCVAILVWAKRLKHAVLIELETDALATAVALTARARSPRMQIILDALLARIEYIELAQRLQVAACMGAGNPLADAASRGYADTLRVLSAALGVESRQVELPPAALEFLTQVLADLSALRPGGGLGATALSTENLNLIGDMPVAHGDGRGGTAVPTPPSPPSPPPPPPPPSPPPSPPAPPGTPPTPPREPPGGEAAFSLAMPTTPPHGQSAAAAAGGLHMPSAAPAAAAPTAPPQAAATPAVAAVGDDLAMPSTPPPRRESVAAAGSPMLIGTPSAAADVARPPPASPGATIKIEPTLPSTPPPPPPLPAAAAQVSRSPALHGAAPSPPPKRTAAASPSGATAVAQPALAMPPTPPQAPLAHERGMPPLEAPRGQEPLLLAKKVSKKSAALLRGLRSSVAEGVYEMLQRDDSEYAIGADEDDLRWLADTYAVGEVDGMALTSQEQLASNWRHWLAFCTRFKISSPLRPDLATLDAEGVKREKVIWTAAMAWIYANSMKPARGKFLPDGRPKPVSPESALAVLRGVRRIHIESGVDTPPLKTAAKRMLELMRAYAKEVGPENVAPQRKAPLTHALITGMLSVGDGSPVLPGGKAWHWSARSGYGRSCRTAIHVLAQCGFRKAEVALASGAKHDKLRLSFANVTWWFDGGTRETATPTLKDLLSMREGDFCGLIPPPSKADQFGTRWMNNTIWLPFSATAPINAARALAQWELTARVPPEKRRETPLFCGPGGVGTSLNAEAFSTLIYRLLLYTVGKEQAAKYSVHSFRSYLASAMVAAGCTDGEVQAALRWASEDALKIYKVPNKEQYGGWLLRAERVKLTGARLAAMPRPPPQFDNERLAALVLDGERTILRAADAGDAEDAQLAAVAAARRTEAAAEAARPPVLTRRVG